MAEREKMKKILVFSHALELGGAERALLGLLQSFDYEQYQVDLFLMRHEGVLMKYIPEEVHLLPEIPEYTCLAVPISVVLRKKKIKVLYGRVKGKSKAAQYVKKSNLNADNGVALEYSHKYTCKYMPNVSVEEYDLAISFLTPHYFVAQKVNAKKKIAWIHTDYSFLDIDVASEENMWNAYNYIASISDACTEGFCSKFPNLRDRIVRIDHMIPADFVRKQAEAYEVTREMSRDGSIRILSVGRFCNAKNFDNVPDICRRLLDVGLNVKWYLIGFGPDEELIKQKIQEAEMEKNVIILGKKANPYPYMKECDWYIQPSRYEGNCVCVHEAQILGKPVIITNYATAASQLDDGVDGIIVPGDNDGCAKQLEKLLLDEKIKGKLINACCAIDYRENTQIQKVYGILKGK